MHAGAPVVVNVASANVTVTNNYYGSKGISFQTLFIILLSALLIFATVNAGYRRSTRERRPAPRYADLESGSSDDERQLRIHQLSQDTPGTRTRTLNRTRQQQRRDNARQRLDFQGQPPNAAAAPAAAAAAAAPPSPGDSSDDEAADRPTTEWRNTHPSYLDHGPPNHICRHGCRAMLWKDELSFNMICCRKGNSLRLLNHFPPPPPLLQHQLLPPGRIAVLGTPNNAPRHLLGAVRRYNNALSMASSGSYAPPRPGISFLAVNGNMHHFIGAARPAPGTQPKFAQLYIIDDAYEQLQSRLQAIRFAHLPELNQDLMRDLQEMLQQRNRLVLEFKQACEIPIDQISQYEIVFKTNGTIDKRRYNAPRTNEVAGFMPGGENAQVAPMHVQAIRRNRTQTPAAVQAAPRDLTVRAQGADGQGNLMRISETHPLYEPLHFVLFYPCGNVGWSAAMEVGQRRKITLRDYCAFFMHDRNPTDYSLFIHGGKLFQEWLMAMHSRNTNMTLLYIVRKQDKLRVTDYASVRAAMRGGATDGSNLGRPTILPSTFVGSPRYMQQCFQDAMAVVRHYGKPDFFITMTCNPKWPEILDQLNPGQSVSDRPDIVARVFRIKLNALIEDLKKGRIFGKATAVVHVVEFQKRGLPHAHILLILVPEDKVRSPEEIDKFVCAEIPDEVAEPELYEAVKNHMLHGPCGTVNPNMVCMEEGHCSKEFPKAFQPETLSSADGYPKYRRRENNSIITKRVRGPEGAHMTFCFDNRWVVPYNPELLLKYNCHINVEVCNSVSSVKYIYKYVFKGHDRAEVLVQEATADGAPTAFRNEVKEYQDGRYFCSPEAAWRLYGFDLHGRDPPVQRLSIHLPDCQPVTVEEQADLAEAEERGAKTTLTQWFVYVGEEKAKYAAALATDPETPVPVAINTTYQNAPLIATWNKEKKLWSTRKQQRKFPTIGRIYHISPTDEELFCLRMLCCHVKGATSFEDMRTTGKGTPDEAIHATFKEACKAWGLLDDDGEWQRCMEDAKITASPKQIRQLFANILAFNNIIDPVALWEEFKEAMAEDYMHIARQQNPEARFEEFIFHHALRDIDQILRDMGHQTLATFGLPTPPRQPEAAVVEAELARYPIQAEAERRDELVPLLNTEQRAIYDRVMLAIEQGTGGVIFVDGVGGAGKTFTYNCLLHVVRAEGKVAMAVASSGIAALLLLGGRTAHSRLKIPVKGLCDTSTCYISRNDPTAELIRNTSVIIWDEAPMMHKHVFEAVDRSLRDIMRPLGQEFEDLPFGGKIVVLGGDFRQILPVIRRGRKADIVAATLNQSDLIWPFVEVFRLHRNMRVQTLLAEGGAEAAANAQRQQQFADYLLRVGDGVEQVHPDHGEDHIHIPLNMCSKGETIEDLLEEVFEGWDGDFTDEERREFIIGRAILAPLNEEVDKVNNLANEKFLFIDANGQPAQRKTYHSVDSVVEEEQRGTYPLEFLNTLEFSGVPPHELQLQEGAPIVLLRNMASGMANGTRLIVKKLYDSLIEAVVATGPMKNETVFLPRLGITPSDNDILPFTLRRRQFPVRSAFAMTINKAQGQTLKKVGVYLPKPVFAHGQLYVSISRSGVEEGVFVMVPGWDATATNGLYVPNVVYREVLLDNQMNDR